VAKNHQAVGADPARVRAWIVVVSDDDPRARVLTQNQLAAIAALLKGAR
jgi:hypothetical protein